MPRADVAKSRCCEERMTSVQAKMVANTHKGRLSKQIIERRTKSKGEQNTKRNELKSVNVRINFLIE